MQLGDQQNMVCVGWCLDTAKCSVRFDYSSVALPSENVVNFFLRDVIVRQSCPVVDIQASEPCAWKDQVVQATVCQQPLGVVVPGA